jgi:hypothetical protein
MLRPDRVATGKFGLVFGLDFGNASIHVGICIGRLRVVFAAGVDGADYSVISTNFFKSVRSSVSRGASVVRCM